MVCWDNWVDTPEFKQMLDKMTKDSLSMIDVMAIFSTGMRYGELYKGPVRK